MNYANELTATIMILLQETYKQTVFLDPEEMIFLRKEISESGSIFYPITNSGETTKPSPILHLNESILLTANDVKKASKSIEKRIFSGLQALQMRVNHHEESENKHEKSVYIPEQNHTTNRYKTDKKAEKKRVDTLRFHGLEPFHENYTDKRFDLILSLEIVTAELLIDGSDRVKEWCKENFKIAKKIAKNDIHGLIVLIDKTHKKRNQQLAAIQTNISKFNKNKVSNKIKIFLTVAAVGISFIVALIAGIKKKVNNYTPKTNIEIKGVFYSWDQVDSLIDLYEETNNVKVYDWRRGQIQSCFKGKKLNEKQAVKIIDSVANYNYKSVKKHQKTTTTNQSDIGYNPNIKTTYKAQ